MSRPYIEIIKVELVLESGQSQSGQNPPVKLANSISVTILLKNVERSYDEGVLFYSPIIYIMKTIKTRKLLPIPLLATALPRLGA